MLNQLKRVFLCNNGNKKARFFHKFQDIKCSTKMQMGPTSTDPIGCTDLVWMDMEMTGLDVQKDQIMEISCIITDKDLNIKSEGPCLEIQHSQATLDKMNAWCKDHHYASGLVEKCLHSQLTITKAEQLLLAYLQSNIPERQCPLAGNSIYMDRLFLRHYMPKVDQYLHYRIVDVSSIKELVKRWNPKVLEKTPKKILTHRSLDDIKESIQELQFYKLHFFST